MLNKCFDWVDQNIPVCSKLAYPQGNTILGQGFSNCAQGNPCMDGRADFVLRDSSPASTADHTQNLLEGRAQNRPQVTFNPHEIYSSQLWLHIGITHRESLNTEAWVSPESLINWCECSLLLGFFLITPQVRLCAGRVAPTACKFSEI